MNANELRAEIARNNLTIPKLAKLINVNKSTLYSRVNGKTPFTQKEITEIAKILNLSKEKIFFIFFTDKVA